MSNFLSKLLTKIVLFINQGSHYSWLLSPGSGDPRTQSWYVKAEMPLQYRRMDSQDFKWFEKFLKKLFERLFELPAPRERGMNPNCSWKLFEKQFEKIFEKPFEKQFEKPVKKLFEKLLKIFFAKVFEKIFENLFEKWFEKLFEKLIERLFETWQCSEILKTNS